MPRIGGYVFGTALQRSWVWWAEVVLALVLQPRGFLENTFDPYFLCSQAGYFWLDPREGEHHGKN